MPDPPSCRRRWATSARGSTDHVFSPCLYLRTGRGLGRIAPILDCDLTYSNARDKSFSRRLPHVLLTDTMEPAQSWVEPWRYGVLRPPAAPSRLRRSLRPQPGQLQSICREQDSKNSPSPRGPVRSMSRRNTQANMPPREAALAERPRLKPGNERSPPTRPRDRQSRQHLKDAPRIPGVQIAGAELPPVWSGWVKERLGPQDG